MWTLPHDRNQYENGSEFISAMQKMWRLLFWLNAHWHEKFRATAKSMKATGMWTDICSQRIHRELQRTKEKKRKNNENEFRRKFHSIRESTTTCWHIKTVNLTLVFTSNVWPVVALHLYVALNRERAPKEQRGMKRHGNRHRPHRRQQRRRIVMQKNPQFVYRRAHRRSEWKKKKNQQRVA